MTCRRFREVHNDYLDGVLSEPQVAEVHAHLIQCPECQRHMEMMRACGDVISLDVRGPRLSASFTDRVMGAVRAPAVPAAAQTKRLVFPHWARWSSGMVAAAALALAVLPMLSRQSAPPREPMVAIHSDASNGVSVVAGVQHTIGGPESDELMSTAKDAREAGQVIMESVEEFMSGVREHAASSAAGAATNQMSFQAEILRPLYDLFMPPVQPVSTDDDIVRG